MALLINVMQAIKGYYANTEILTTITLTRFS